MSNVGPEKRSFQQIEPDDLRRLAVLALADLDGLFRRKPRLDAAYRHGLLALTLCQGAAEHYLRPGRGVNDFDVWAFFRADPSCRFPYRRRGERDFGPSKFGHNPDEVGFRGRRVDIIGRDIPASDGEEAAEAIHRYLATDRNKSPRLLAERPVIQIYPEPGLGRIIWDPSRDGGTC
jgi:hypothetical protein